MAIDVPAPLVGKSGEFLVAAELMRRGVHVAYPAYDGGIDLIAYHERDLNRLVPIQVKARSGTCYTFQKAWFRIGGLVLVQVWYVTDRPEYYIFGGLQDVEEALGGQHVTSMSWTQKGGYNVTNPGPEAVERMQAHRNRWDRIVNRIHGSGKP